MCLIVTVRAEANVRPLLESVTRSLPPSALRLDVDHTPCWPWAEPTHVQAVISETGGCACSLLADDADWDAEVWSMRPEVLAPLAQTLAGVGASELDEFTVEALWTGEQPEAERWVSLQETVSLARTGQLGTKTRYHVRDEP
jgi:hypothetical protein